jgi:UDPglucose--hexose-1-phosphate uridylyltransferase
MAAESHRRFNPLRQEWVIVSPHRNERPWQGQVDPRPRIEVARHDPQCYLCPGSRRAHGVQNPDYQATFSFDNDFPALVPGPSPVEIDRPPIDDLLLATTERGICRVICFSPRHDLTLARMDLPSVRRIVDTWADECASAAANPVGEVHAGLRKPRRHDGRKQPASALPLWATEHVPNEPAREWQAFEAYQRTHTGACLLCDYLARETRVNERVIFANDAFVALVPFWATWPFEALLVSRRHLSSFGDLTSLRARWPCECAVASRRAVRRAVRFAVSLFGGFSSSARQRSPGRRLAFSRAFLSAAPSIGDHPQVHGRFRIAWIAAAGLDAGGSRSAAAGTDSMISRRTFLEMTALASVQLPAFVANARAAMGRTVPSIAYRQSWTVSTGRQ